MIFSSLTFIFIFLPIFLLFYYTIPYQYRNIVLLIGSLIFYSYGALEYLILLLLSITVNYKAAIVMDSLSENPVKKKKWLIYDLIYNFGILFAFKYMNFFIHNINGIMHGLNFHSRIPDLQIVLPLGISFYTFQIVSYVIDVYWGKIKAERSVAMLGLYLSMFPQLISGPIVKYQEISDKLRSRYFSFENLERGLKMFTVGLGFKVLIANRIAILWNDIQTIGFESISTPLAWLGAIGYTIQLYFDFYGYSLMAVGVGTMLGFTLPDNFDHPYISKSVSEFWRRWHITLGRWFRDYVYIPLGGNRRGPKRLVINLFVVWLLTGLWHGAGWNFILWGVVLFALISTEKLFLNKYLGNHNILSRVYVLIIMPLTWMIFAISRLSDLGTYFGRMFAVVPGIYVNQEDFIKYLGIYHLYFLLGIFFCLPLGKRWYQKYEKSMVCTIVLFAVFWYAIYQLANGLNNPFMYFKF